MAFQLIDILANLFGNTVNFLPSLISAVILLAIGLVVGKIVGRVIKEVIVKLKVDYYVHEKEKAAFNIADLFSLITRWWIYLAFIAAALSTEVLGLPALSLWVTKIVDFIPGVIGASVTIVTAYVLGEYAKSHLKKTGTAWGILSGKILFFFILYVALALALQFLGISATLVNNILLVIIASVGLGVAIALGLGLKDAVSIVSKKYANKMKV